MNGIGAAGCGVAVKNPGAIASLLQHAQETEDLVCEVAKQTEDKVGAVVGYEPEPSAACAEVVPDRESHVSQIHAMLDTISRRTRTIQRQIERL